jgi:hypothetical protein
MKNQRELTRSEKEFNCDIDAKIKELMKQQEYACEEEDYQLAADLEYQMDRLEEQKIIK